MTGPEWVNWLFAALFGLVALYSAVQLFAARAAPGDRVRRGAHLVMALGMLVMFLPSADPLPPLVWTGVFVLVGAWLGAEVLRTGAAGTHPPDRGHQIHLVISMAAMVYMFATMTSAAADPAAAAGSGHHHGGDGVNLIAVNIALTGYFLLHALWSGARLVRPALLSTTEGVAVTAVAGRLPDACHLVMGLGMGYMFAAALG
jgi:uncharacterized protein DUF5134